MNYRTLAVIAFLSLSFAGCATPHPEAVQTLTPYSTATVGNQDGDIRKPTKEVSVEALTPLLVRARWIDHNVMSMGGFWITYPNGQRLFIAIGFDFFRLEGVRGHFEIRPEDIPAYRQAIDTIRKTARKVAPAPSATAHL